jgi:hypothetical protein
MTKRTSQNFNSCSVGKGVAIWSDCPLRSPGCLAKGERVSERVSPCIRAEPPAEILQSPLGSLPEGTPHVRASWRAVLVGATAGGAPLCCAPLKNAAPWAAPAFGASDRSSVSVARRRVGLCIYTRARRHGLTPLPTHILEADDGNLLTEAPGAPVKLFTIGGLRLELDALLPAN